jgi:hypothetical protein
MTNQTISEMRAKKEARIVERRAYWEARIAAEHAAYLRVMAHMETGKK